MIHEAFERRAAIFSPPHVWQIVPPRDYKDRMASEGAPVTPPGGYPLSYHGGPVIQAPKLAIVYLGQWWGNGLQLDAFAKDLMTCGYLSACSQYGVTGQGTYLGSFPGPSVGVTVTDADLRAIVGTMSQASDASTLNALVLPAGTTVQEGSSASCAAFCGYHSVLADGKTFYSVHPNTNCPGCNLGDAFVGFTMVLAHEVAEWATDPVPGTGWFNDGTGMENADEWAWTAESYGPWTVQGYQVNGLGNGYGPYNCGGPTGPDLPAAVAAIDAAQRELVTAQQALQGASAAPVGAKQP